MKKKLLSIALAFALAIGVTGQSTVYADEVTEVANAIAVAEEKQIGTDYSVTWSDEVGACWSKVTLNEKGIFQVNFTKIESETFGFIDVGVRVYDETGKSISVVWDEESQLSASVFIGLDSGTYFVKLYPEYPSYSHDRTTNYNFSFTPTEYCESERDNSRLDATPMKVGAAYTGYLGSGFGCTSDDKDYEDNYEIQLKKGQVYRLTFDNAKGTTIVKMLGKDSEPDNTWPSTDAKKFCVSPAKTFIAPYSGTYYIRIYNYSNDQYKYTVKVENLSSKKTSLTSIKAGKASLTVKWKKVNCDGYQIQYSTKSNFKGAKSVTVSRKKASTTIKKLSSKKKYYVRVRSYLNIDNQKAYSSWYKVKSVKVK